MNVQRVIAIYEKDGEKQLKEIILSESIFSSLEKIINKDADDPNAYKVYRITKNQFLKLLAILPKLSNIDFNKVELFFECYQV
jgi:hypothetical protein